MGIIYLLIVAFLFSFGGTCAKIIAPYYSSEYISFFRFFIGVFFLLLLKLITRHRFAADFREALKKNAFWLVLGGAAKAGSYLCENYALTHGLSYMNILTQPSQLLFITLVSVLILREKLSLRKALFIVPVVVGVLMVSWNGRPLQEYLTGNLRLTGFYVLSGIGAGTFMFAQKKVADSMHIIDSNMTMFSVSALVTLIPTIGPTLNGAVAGVVPSIGCIAALLFFGFITGIGFYLNAKAIPLVPLYLVSLLQCTMVLFSIIWGVLFFHEPVTLYIIVGSLLFVTGIIGVQTA